ncbi:MAG: hypothetical protein DMF61_15595 [Blastocatellia bacterium AA13]|nr:MAG: hypothetical protein DMF61_15595 [Blastocatellia bacterium AA13]
MKRAAPTARLSSSTGRTGDHQKEKIMRDDDKIRILFLAANPTNVKFQPRLDREVKEIRRKIQASGYGNRFQLIPEWAVTSDDLQAALLEHKPHILHFSGHGSKKAGIILEDAQGKCFFLDKNAFADVLRVLKDNIRIVVLNACYSTDQASYLTDIIDFTIGMGKAIGDDAARTFAAHFYQALAWGRSIEDAFKLGQGQIDLSRIPASGCPQLLVRHGVDRTKPLLVKLESGSGKSQKRAQRPGERPGASTPATKNEGKVQVKDATIRDINLNVGSGTMTKP